MKGEFEEVVGYFDSEGALREALRRARELYITDVEVYLPVGDQTVVEEARPGPPLIPWIALGGGVLGFGAGMFLTVWTSIDYPLITGGKPIVSLPPFLLVAFQTAVLFASLAAFVGFILLAGLPRYTPGAGYRQRVAVDRFALVVRPYEAVSEAREMLYEAGALCVHHLRAEDRRALEEVP